MAGEVIVIVINFEYLNLFLFWLQTWLPESLTVVRTTGYFHHLLKDFFFQFFLKTVQCTKLYIQGTRTYSAVH
jgi:hypothetical protein